MTAQANALHYSMVIEWSDEDDAFLVTLPEWEERVFNPVTHGGNYEEASLNGRLALEDLVAVAIKDGLPLPEPRKVVLSV